MAGEKILVVEDEARYRRLIQFNLAADGYGVTCVSSGEEALETMAHGIPDLVILDILLPGLDGFEVCQRIREVSTVPIVMLTALGSNEQKVKGLRLGADDYVTKPFSAQELLARVDAVLRRVNFSGTAPEQGSLSFGDLQVDLLKHRVTLGEEEIAVSPTEYRLLSYLAANAGKALTQDDILERVWDASYRGDHEVLRVNIWRLRNKLRDDPQNPVFISTIPGIGYMMLNPT